MKRILTSLIVAMFASPCCAADVGPQWVLVYVVLLPVAAVVKGVSWLLN